MDAAKLGDIFITVTGNLNVIDKHHMEVMKDGAILANSGHFNDEINIPALVEMAGGARPRWSATSWKSSSCPTAASSTCWPMAAWSTWPPPKATRASVMDMSFANQALAAEYMVKNGTTLEAKVYVIPQELDHEIALLKLPSMGINIDTLTEEQKKYLASWESGT